MPRRATGTKPQERLLSSEGGNIGMYFISNYDVPQKEAPNGDLRANE